MANGIRRNGGCDDDAQHCARRSRGDGGEQRDGGTARGRHPRVGVGCKSPSPCRTPQANTHGACSLVAQRPTESLLFGTLPIAQAWTAILLMIRRCQHPASLQPLPWSFTKQLAHNLLLIRRTSLGRASCSCCFSSRAQSSQTFTPRGTWSESRIELLCMHAEIVSVGLHRILFR